MLYSTPAWVVNTIVPLGVVQVGCVVDAAVGVVGEAVTTILRLDVDAVHGALLIVQTKTYVPAPPDGVNVANRLVISLN
jgi:hypothetical protein